jgi:FtsZ-binding cell division protein ZapB
MAHIGDLVPKSGIYTEPGVVVEKKENGNVVVSTEPMAVNKYHRYTNTSGLSEADKLKFNEILDQIYQKEDMTERINDIQVEIDRLKTEPQSHNIVQYLRNQQTYLVRESKKLPNTYQTDEKSIVKTVI